MRTLLLYRHAKSSWDDWSLDDFDRPLTARGKKAAPLMGDFIRAQNIMPDRIACSPGLRTRQTLERTQIQVTTAQKNTFPKSLFHAQDMTLLQEIHTVGDHYQCLCIIAHNPAIHSLGAYLASDSNNNKARQKLEKKFPTAGLAVFSTSALFWQTLTPENCKLLHFVTPKILTTEIKS